jgi:hypothetical protein
LSAFRPSVTVALTNVNTTAIRPQLLLTYSIGEAIDITLRIGLPQLEQGAFATSAILTTTAAATRAADVAVMQGANFSNWYNQAEGSFYAEGGQVVNGGSMFSVHDGAFNNYIAHMFRFGISSRTWTFASGVEQTNISNTVSGTVKHALVYAANDFAQSVNGLAVVTDTTATVPVVNQLNIGLRVTANHLNGHIRRLAFFPRRLADAELTAITS